MVHGQKGIDEMSGGTCAAVPQVRDMTETINARLGKTMNPTNSQSHVHANFHHHAPVALEYILGSSQPVR